MIECDEVRCSYNKVFSADEGTHSGVCGDPEKRKLDESGNCELSKAPAKDGVASPTHSKGVIGLLERIQHEYRVMEGVLVGFEGRLGTKQVGAFRAHFELIKGYVEGFLMLNPHIEPIRALNDVLNFHKHKLLEYRDRGWLPECEYFNDVFTSLITTWETLNNHDWEADPKDGRPVPGVPVVTFDGEVIGITRLAEGKVGEMGVADPSESLGTFPDPESGD